MESHTKTIVDDCARLRAEFKDWKERETLKILSCAWACPEGIQHMWAHLRLQEETFERSLARATSSDALSKQVKSGPNQPQDTGAPLEPFTINPDIIKPKTVSTA